MTTRQKTPSKPATGWWSTPPARWLDVSDATHTRFHKNQRGKVRLDEEAAKAALAFGFGARDQYGEHRAWKDLEAQLQTDWQETGRDQAWELVVKAVKNGWTAGATHTDEAVEPSAPAEPHAEDPDYEAAPRNVPGGRPDRHE